MRISDWSSDVCSSDLTRRRPVNPARVASRSARPLPAILFAPKIRNPRMAKARTAYVCSECGADFNKWQGQCGACGAWVPLSEIVLDSAAAQKSPESSRARKGGGVGKRGAGRVAL